MDFIYVEQSKPVEGNYGKFGLNQNVEVLNFAFNPNGGAGNTPKECIDFTFKVEEQEFRHRFFPLENAFENGKLTPLKDFTDKSLAKRLSNTWLENILNIARCFVAEDVLKSSLSKLTGDYNNFQYFAKTIEKLIKTSPKFKGNKVDVFLEWQRKISANQTKTYLTFGISEGQYPEGLSITEHIDKEFSEVKDDKGLRYITEDGYQHPISRNAYYFRDTNKKAKRQELNSTNVVGSLDAIGSSESVVFDDLPF